MEPSQFSPAEMDSLLKEAASWLKKQRDYFLPKSVPLEETQKTSLRLFFPAQVLERARVADASQSGETIPYPPFYERVRAGGERVVPDAAHMAAMAFGEVIVFNRQPTLRTLFHNLVHVLQMDILGVEPFLKVYFETLNEAGLWMVVPFEEQAYQLDARYTMNPSDVFSVEKEIQDWVRSGRYGLC